MSAGNAGRMRVWGTATRLVPGRGQTLCAGTTGWTVSCSHSTLPAGRKAGPRQAGKERARLFQ